MPQNQSSQEPPDRQGSESDAAGWIMLGDLIANLDRPDVTAAVLTTLDPIIATRIEQRAAAAAMAVADFAARTVSRLRGASRWRALVPTAHYNP
jgi:hypothetical protein